MTLIYAHCLNLSLHLHPYCVYSNSKGSDQPAHMPRLVGALLLTFYISTKISCIGPYSFAPCGIIMSWDIVWFGTYLLYVSLLSHLKLHTYFKQNVNLFEKLLLVDILLS